MDYGSSLEAKGAVDRECVLYQIELLFGRRKNNADKEHCIANPADPLRAACHWDWGM